MAFTGQDLTRFRANIMQQYYKRKNVKKQDCTLIHCDSSPQEQKNMFCVLHGDSFTFPASSPSFCHFHSPSFSLSPYLCPHSLESISCLSKVHLLIFIHTPLPSFWPEVHKLWIFPVTDTLRLASVRADAPGDPCVDGYTLKAPTVYRHSAQVQ